MIAFKYPSVLTIAGFDSSGGAGIQADIKTISSLGCYATSVLTALPVQNTTGVKSIYPIPLQAVREQIDVVMEDIMPDAIKIGMVHTSELVYTIIEALKQYPDIPLIFDPVMVATSGDYLIEPETIAVIQNELFPRCELITPNMDEAAILSNTQITNLREIEDAGPLILSQGCKNVLIKGGHLNTPKLTSILFSKDGSKQRYETTKIETVNIHGSGCTLSSAIASFVARGFNLPSAIEHAQHYVFASILSGKDVRTGKGNGPLNHFHQPLKMIKNELE